MKPYDIVKTAAGTVVAEFFFTSKSHSYPSPILLPKRTNPLTIAVALLPAGPLLLSPAPVWYASNASNLSTEKKIQDAELSALLTQPLRASKKKAKKTAEKAE